MDDSICQLCNDLNLDKPTVDEVWKSFTKVKEQFIIEGDRTHWIACAIYVTINKNSSKSSTPNGVHLAQLLRCCKLSLVDFLSMMDKWLKMTEQGGDIRSKIAHLERNFNVSAVVFKKYKELFPYVFKPLSAKPKDHQDKTLNRTRKSTASARLNYELTTADIYYFCWVLYINTKATRPTTSEDLVDSYHLLLACIDFCYSNVLVTKFAHDLLNPKFEGLPDNFQSDDFKLQSPVKQPMCVLQVLCNSWDGIVVNAKEIREHWLRPHIKELVNKKVLQATLSNDPPNTHLGVFDPSNFESNMSKLIKEHDFILLSVGDFDERIFLSENAQKELGAPVYDLSDLKRMISERDSLNGTPSSNSHEFADLDKQRPSLENGGRFVPQTPLSNQNNLANRTIHPSSPVANATRKIGDLYRMLVECKGEPTASLENIFELCTINPRKSIMDRAAEMADRLLEAYTSPPENSNASDQAEPQAIEHARKRVDLARKLYFKVLEAIIIREQKRLPTDKIGDSLSSLLSHEIFHISLFACCVEIVLASHNATYKTFPWVLEVYKDFGETKLYPFLFYKVIELVIREEERLSRDIVKHLATIEEKVLDSMAWESDSPLWTAIAANGRPPSCQDVDLPPTHNMNNSFEMSPISSLRRQEGFHSPMRPSDRYFSAPSEGSARRRLFECGLSGDEVSTTTTQAHQILQVVMPHKSENGEVKYQPYVVLNMNASSLNSDHSIRQEIDHSPAPIRPTAKANPVNLFFRKVYYLAQLRFRDLWNRLNIEDSLKQKIWTLFEDQIKNHTNLLRDRHLDQMIMCATYAVIKVCDSRRSSTFFKEIMKAYRSQPQASVAVYQDVLLAKPPLRLLDDGVSQSPSVTRSPSKRPSTMNSPIKNGSGQSSSSSNTSQTQLPERGDIISFYNQVYLPQVKSIMMMFATQPDNSLNLSPLPRMNTNPISPWRKVSQQHSIYVSPLKSNSVPSSPGRQLSYNFHRSPAKDLQTINNMINRQRAACKRILQDDDGENTKRHCISDVAHKKINDIMNDRGNSRKS